MKTPKLASDKRIGNNGNRPKSRKTENGWNLCTWNVLSLYRPGATQKLLDELLKYKIDILAVQEIRWNGNGIIDKRNHRIYYSCHESAHSLGVGFIVSKKMQHLVIGWQHIDERMCVLRIKGKFFNMSIINVHAPTEEKPAETKDEFYDKLMSVYDHCTASDIKIVIGDCNAQVGKEDIFLPHIGKNSLHDVSNDNGVRLVDFAASRNMIVGSTRYQHKISHKVTWTSPNGKHSQIDHILIDARHASNILDVRSLRGANADSDHNLVRAKIRARISCDAKRNPVLKQTKYNTAKLQEEDIRERYACKISHSIGEIKTYGNNDIDDDWNACKIVIQEAATEVIGLRPKPATNEWFDDECRAVTNIKNEVYKKMLSRPATRTVREEYRLRRKQEKAVHKRKKRDFENDKLKQLELSHEIHDHRQFFGSSKEIRREFEPRTVSCKDKQGNLLSSETEVMRRWAEHFSDLLNSVTTPEPIEPTVLNNIDYQEPPTLNEVRAAIRKLKNNKAPGSDGLPAELFRWGGEELLNYLKKLIERIWNEGKMPDEWNRGLICPLHKKGCKLKCENYRGITLLNTAYKIFSNVLFDRLLPHAEQIVGQYQAGFRPERSTIDQIFVLRQMVEKTLEFNIQTHHLFIDFKAAYDSISREKLVAALNDFGIPAKLIQMIQMTMSNIRCQVKLGCNVSETFATNKGLRQGDALACVLFNLALEKAVRDSDLVTTGTIYTKSQTALAYADDLDLVARSAEGVKDSFGALEKAAKNMGLEINEDKTKYMKISPSQTNRAGLSIGQYNFKATENFIYLGSLVNENGKLTEEIKRRIMLANRCFFGLRKQFSSRLLSRASKLRLYKTLVRPVLLYGSETWTMTRREEILLELFERKVLRSIFGAIYDTNGWRRRFNHEIYALLQDPNVVEIAKINRLRYAGHVQRRENDHPAKQHLTSNPSGQRRRGRPRVRWADEVDNDARALGVNDWRQLSQDRDGWRKTLESAKTHHGLYS